MYIYNFIFSSATLKSMASLIITHKTYEWDNTSHKNDKKTRHLLYKKFMIQWILIV